ncbi:hypothetical protein F4778DRAFT_721387 [Xylariomycetidae sp. FL2044]|nr:hypothetical protein F4778DRAFT_721387 [Xylariomycetidae sp. FL2044]
MNSSGHTQPPALGQRPWGHPVQPSHSTILPRNRALGLVRHNGLRSPSPRGPFAAHFRGPSPYYPTLTSSQPPTFPHPGISVSRPTHNDRQTLGAPAARGFIPFQPNEEAEYHSENLPYSRMRLNERHDARVAAETGRPSSVPSMQLNTQQLYSTRNNRQLLDPRLRPSTTANHGHDIGRPHKRNSPAMDFLPPSKRQEVDSTNHNERTGNMHNVAKTLRPVALTGTSPIDEEDLEKLVPRRAPLFPKRRIELSKFREVSGYTASSNEDDLEKLVPGQATLSPKQTLKSSKFKTANLEKEATSKDQPATPIEGDSKGTKAPGVTPMEKMPSASAVKHAEKHIQIKLKPSDKPTRDAEETKTAHPGPETSSSPKPETQVKKKLSRTRGKTTRTRPQAQKKPAVKKSIGATVKASESASNPRENVKEKSKHISFDFDLVALAATPVDELITNRLNSDAPQTLETLQAEILVNIALKDDKWLSFMERQLESDEGKEDEA